MKISEILLLKYYLFTHLTKIKLSGLFNGQNGSLRFRILSDSSKWNKYMLFSQNICWIYKCANSPIYTKQTQCLTETNREQQTWKGSDDRVQTMIDQISLGYKQKSISWHFLKFLFLVIFSLKIKGETLHTQTLIWKKNHQKNKRFIKAHLNWLFFRLFFLFFWELLRFCRSKSIYVVVFATAVKYTLGNEVSETYKMKFASSWMVNSVHPEKTTRVFSPHSFVCEGEIMTVFRCCLIILSKFECQICFAGVAHGIIELHNVDKVLIPYYT